MLGASTAAVEHEHMQSTVNIQKSVTVERTPINWTDDERPLEPKAKCYFMQRCYQEVLQQCKTNIVLIFLHLQPNSEFGSSFPLVSNDSQTVDGKADKNNNETTGEKKDLVQKTREMMIISQSQQRWQERWHPVLENN